MFSDPITDAVNSALARLLAGAAVDEIESQLIDCKEPYGSVQRDGQRSGLASASPAVRDDAARQLASEVACLAHGGGGALVIGVRDDRSGIDAVVGCDLDADWLRLRLHEMTEPPLTVAIDGVDVPAATDRLGPLLVVRVPPAVELHGVSRADGTGGRPHRWRVGKACMAMSVADQAAFVLKVRPTDWSEQPTSLSIGDVDAGALAAARSLVPSLRASDDEKLLSRLGVLNPDGHLNRAGGLLFCEAADEAIVFTVHDAPGASSRVGRISYSPPLLAIFDDLFARLDTVLPVELLPASGVRREAHRAIPSSVVREAIANAIAHRDWNQRMPIGVAVIGNQVVEVTSPGGFPSGVSADNILSHPSKPTNPVLAHALSVLQIAERQGVGVDLMYREMIRLGHQPPEIDAVGGSVRCRIVGGPADPRSIHFFEKLPSALSQDVEVAIALHHLRRQREIDAAGLAPLIQRGETVASAALQRAANHELVERATRSSEQWRLTKRAQADFLAPPPSRRTTEDLALEVVGYAMGTRATFARADIEEVLGISERRSRQILEELLQRGWLATTGASTGRSVRYQRGAAWPHATRAFRQARP